MQLNNSDPILSGITGLFYTTNISFCCFQLRYFQNPEIESHPHPTPPPSRKSVCFTVLYSRCIWLIQQQLHLYCTSTFYSKTNLQKKLFETWNYFFWVWDYCKGPKIYINWPSKIRLFWLRDVTYVMMCIAKLYIYAYTLCSLKNSHFQNQHGLLNEKSIRL